ncbi:MAG: hypothetical protein CM15mP103_08760 [Gammaproteobacteria bacterium]|nr:MAG: hypothetical protein CM15mP103_08760 [Gammaproteobacteria bacterium]
MFYITIALPLPLEIGGKHVRLVRTEHDNASGLLADAFLPLATAIVLLY